MIYINQVLQSVKDSKRIRIVEIKESYVYIVNVDAITSMPKKELFISFLTDVEQREWIIITDSFARVIEDEYTHLLQAVWRTSKYQTVLRKLTAGELEAYNNRAEFIEESGFID